MTVKIRQLNTENRQEVRRFVDFQFNLYADCDKWSPPLVSSVKLAMNRHKHPFYNHSDAAFFLAERGDKILARVAVLEHRRYNEYTQRNVAFFYYFDAVNDPQATCELFDVAAHWARARDLNMLMGSKGMLRSDALGILVEGFEHEAALSMPYNYDYYPQLMQAAGFEKEVDYLSGYLIPEQKLPERLFRLADKIKERRGFWVKSFKTKRELRKWVPRIQRVNNEAFTDVWGYYPIDEAEVRMIGKQFLSVANPRLMKVVMKGEDIAGFAFVFPDISATLREVRGRLWPLGWIKVLRALKTTRRMSGNGVGLLPKYHGFGASALLYAEFDKSLRSVNAVHCDIAQAMETNVNSLGDMNMLGVNWYKRHRVYHKAL